jgi:tetratricopeptide (TPR) repeat protein
MAILGTCFGVWLAGSPAAIKAGQTSSQPRRELESGTARKRPSAEEVRSALARATSLLRDGRYPDAAEALQSLSCLGCDPRVSLLLAAALEGSGEPSRARQTLEEAHSLWPANNSIATALARQYLLIGRASQAAEVLASCDVSATTPPQELALRVQVELTVNNLLEAERVAKLAYHAHPSEDSMLLLANVLQMQGRGDGVVSFLQGKRDQYRSSPKFLITLAESEYDTPNYAASRRDLEQAISVDPASEQAHYLLGNTLVQLKDVDRAISEYNTAIRLSPRKPRTHYALALALLLRADDAGAERSLRESLAIDPQYAPAHFDLGKLYKKQGRLPRAVEEFKNAINSNPQYAAAYYQLGETYCQMGDASDSAEAFKLFNSIKEKRRSSPGRDHPWKTISDQDLTVAAKVTE